MRFINTIKYSNYLRRKGLNKEKNQFLITNFIDTLQYNDLTKKPNCSGFGRIHHFRRKAFSDWPMNPLPIDPACAALNLPKVDVLEVQLFQIAICSWRCWYCFVDNKLLCGDTRYSKYLSIEELIELYNAEANPPCVIDLSGGQPDLVPEWTYHFVKALEQKRNDKKIYLWSDDNLSNDFIWKYLTKEQVDYLSKASNYGRVGCFKGFDDYSFSFNTKADPSLFKKQFKIMKRLVDSKFDIYGYVTLTTNRTNDLYKNVKIFIDRLQNEIDPIFPLRIIPLKILNFTPTAHRITDEQKIALEVQYDVMKCWLEELNKRYSQKEINQPIYSNTFHS